MDVDHVGEEIQGRQHLEHGAAEVDRPRVIIAKAEHPVAVVKRRAVDEVDDDLAKSAFVDRRGHHVGAEGHLDIGCDRTQAIPADVDLPVPREHHAHVVADMAELLGEGRRDIGHAAQLRERRKLGRRHQHLQVLGVRRFDCRGQARNPDAERA